MNVIDALREINRLGKANAFRCTIDEVLSAMGRHVIYSDNVNDMLAAATECAEDLRGWLIRGENPFGEPMFVVVTLDPPMVLAIGPHD